MAVFARKARRIFTRWATPLTQLVSPDTLKRFLSLSSWTMVSFALSKGAMMIVVIYLARVLGAEDYGRLTLTQGLVNVLGLFVILGAGPFVSKHVPQMLQESPQRAVQIVNLSGAVIATTSLLLCIAVPFAKGTVAVNVLSLPTGSPIPSLVLGWVILMAFNELMLIALLSLEKGKALGTVALVVAGLSLSVVPWSGMRWGLQGAVAGFIVVESIRFVVAGLVYFRVVKGLGANPFVWPHRSDLPLLLTFGLPVFLTSAMYSPTIWGAQLVVKAFAPDGLVAVGVYGLMSNILGALLLVSSLTNQAAMPVFSSLFAAGNGDELKRASRLLCWAQMAVAAAISIPIALCAPFILSYAGPAFAAAWPAFLLMLGVGVITAGQTSLGNYLLATNRPYFILGTTLPWSLIVLSAAFLFSSHGVYALAGGMLVGAIARVGLFIWGFTKQLRPAASAA
ncbi:oligosaccharide flippase family protein [Sphingomonas flavalba]|uniref:oligosaccharide flippase family protein n=1 Tax=Sphingomonas flavalba TaxID=2559804 RepID=UPI00109E337C|nr:oligosaccharide flippase family protein [Sphingomonas flavalba]